MARTPDEVRESKRLYMARKRKENPEKMREYQRSIYYKNHEARKEKMRSYYADHFFWGRSMKLRGDTRASAVDVENIWNSQNGLCALTGRVLDREHSQLDHIIPKARGGSDEKENLRWVCTEANLMKRDLTDDELIRTCSDIVRWIGERIEKYGK